MDVGKRIQERREQLGMSQTQLAIKMGYSNRSAVSRAETSGDDIGTNRLKKFAEALNCSPAYLMGWEEIDKQKLELEHIGRISAYIDKFEMLTDKNKIVVDGLVDSLLKSQGGGSDEG